MDKVIPAVNVDFSPADRREILARIDECLTAGYLSQGRGVAEFEESFARYIGCGHAVAVANGGAALEGAMRALGARGREVLVPTNTFFATPAAVLAAGGAVKLVDIDPATLAPSAKMIEQAIAPATAGLIIVHIGGIVSREILEIRHLCAARGIWLFEDCAHAHGSSLGGIRTGGLGIGGAYSFFSTKVITSGEGGMLVTDDENLAHQLRLMRNYGKPDPWISNSVGFGLNWRLNELAAIVGTVQLRRLDEFIEWRTKIAAVYLDELNDDPRFRLIRPADRSSWYKFIVVLPPDLDRAYVKQFLADRGISLAGGVYDLPLHRQPVFEGLYDSDRFPVADEFCARHICLPIYYGLAAEDARRVVRTLRQAADQRRAKRSVDRSEAAEALALPRA